MEQPTSSSLSRMEQLSVELRQIILSSVPDIDSLESAALTCRAIYKAFLSAESLITTRVLQNQVGLEVLPEAIITQQSAHLMSYTKDSVKDFIETHLKPEHTPRRSWALKYAHPIGKLHAVVHDVALAYAAFAMASVSLNVEPRPFVPRQVEIGRIERRLYRIEIFCNLFRNLSDYDTLRPLWNAFFSSFSPWQNEQLIPIHNFLTEAVFPAFTDVAKNDRAWSEYRSDYGCDPGSPYIQYQLSLGLERLWEIANAKTYEARYDLLHTDQTPKARDPFLYKALIYANIE